MIPLAAGNIDVPLNSNNMIDTPELPKNKQQVAFMEAMEGKNGGGTNVSDVVEGTGKLKPSLPDGSKPIGKYSPPNSPGLIRQNETADLLASKGYKEEGMRLLLKVIGSLLKKIEGNSIFLGDSSTIILKKVDNEIYTYNHPEQYYFKISFDDLGVDVKYLQ